MFQKPHIVRKVAEESRRLYYDRLTTPNAYIRPRLIGEEIGVEFTSGEFIPYADLGYSYDVGFFRLSESADTMNDALPYAATGQLIDLGQIILTMSVSKVLSNEDIHELLRRHSTGDFGEYGEFYDLEITDEMLVGEERLCGESGPVNKINTLTGLSAVTSEYLFGMYRIRVITEAGQEPSTIFLMAGVDLD